MRHTRRWSLIFLLSLLVLGSQAQETLRPLQREELWLSMGVRGRLPKPFSSLLGKDLYKKIRTNADLGYRSADVFFAGRQVYIDAGATVELSDHVKVGIEHRVADRPNASIRQRTGFVGQYRIKPGRAEFDYRFIYQHNYRDFGEQREVFRNRFSAGYNIPGFKLDPQFSVEFFTWAGNRGLSYFGTRYKLGTELSMGKTHSFDIAIVHDRERDVFAPTVRTILSLGYTLALNKL